LYWEEKERIKGEGIGRKRGKGSPKLGVSVLHAGKRSSGVAEIQRYKIGLLCMPVLSGEGVPEAIVTGLGELGPNNGYPRQARHLSCGGVYLDLTKVRSEIPLRLRGEILVPKEDDGPLGDEEGELVLLRLAELGELQAYDLGSEVRRKINDFLGRSEEVLLAGISAKAGILVLASAGANRSGKLEVTGAFCSASRQLCTRRRTSRRFSVALARARQR
jgi:hypothetical protein